MRFLTRSAGDKTTSPRSFRRFAAAHRAVAPENMSTVALSSRAMSVASRWLFRTNAAAGRILRACEREYWVRVGGRGDASFRRVNNGTCLKLTATLAERTALCQSQRQTNEAVLVPADVSTFGCSTAVGCVLRKLSMLLFLESAFSRHAPRPRASSFAHGVSFEPEKACHEDRLLRREEP